MGPGLVSRIKIMAGMNIVERRRPQDGQLTIDDRRQGSRRPRRDDRRRSWARAASCESSTRRGRCFRLDDLGMPADTHDGVLQDRARALRHGAVRGTDGQREDDDALRHPERGQQPDAQRHDDRGPGRVRLSRRSTRSRPTIRPGSRSPPGCNRSCARTPTSSWSARSATSRRRASPCSRR